MVHVLVHYEISDMARQKALEFVVGWYILALCSLRPAGLQGMGDDDFDDDGDCWDSLDKVQSLFPVTCRLARSFLMTTFYRQLGDARRARQMMRMKRIWHWKLMRTARF